MLEVEVKYRVADLAPLEKKLASWQGPTVRREVDQYFNAPDRDFARTDEAFRIRRVDDKNVLTYKGPKRDAQTKTRFELELPLADGEHAAAQWRELLVKLGYRPSGIVAKTRRLYRLQRDGFEIQAALDLVEELGAYAELEVVAPESDFPAAKALVLNIAEELGLTNPERQSYLQLLLSSQKTVFHSHTVVTIDDLRREVAHARSRGLTIGLVPTMGALHAGHAALIHQARQECGFVVVSIFVNPTQFGPNEDFAKYPRTLDEDLKLCRQLGVDLVFTPSPEVVYPAGFGTFVEIGRLADVFEGAIRPGHFRGVATVVLKLFNMVGPDVAYFGQKDAQQVAVIQQLVRDLDVPVKLVIVPTVREPDGLALSSRNRYLDSTQRNQAPVLARALSAAKDAAAQGQRQTKDLAKLMRSIVATAQDAQLDYAAVVDAATFAEPAVVSGRALAIIAARFGTTRLIDNMVVNDER
jgi:pantoate--beta-alanine ligase